MDELGKNDPKFCSIFKIVLSRGEHKNYIREIAAIASQGGLTKEKVDSILETHDVQYIDDIKEELIDLALLYISHVLEDDMVSDDERRNIQFLKLLFNIKEGDFMKMRYETIDQMLQNQFNKMYRDDRIVEYESLQLVALQEVFDLGYDQFDMFKERQVRRALRAGAPIADLDTALPRLLSKGRPNSSERDT